MGYRKGYYRKDGTYVQGHFTNMRSRSFSNKNQGCMLLFLAFTLITSIISCSDSSDGADITPNSNCPTKTCGDFSSQAAAQAAYNSNKACYKSLDGDGNGKACESLPK